MPSLTADQIALLRESLSRANPGFSAERIDAAMASLVRQHEDQEEHDRSLIAERMAWTPDERLRALQAFLDFIAGARAARPR